MMQTRLEMHVASHAERTQAHRNVYDVWGCGPDVATHVQRRLQSVHHNRARWYVGCLDGRVATSLACYPLRFRVNGRVEPGIAIASVYTLAEFRRRGFAAQLMRFAEDEERARGAALSVLYSDIDPNYYARMGYQLCPSWEGWIDVSRWDPGGAENEADFASVDPRPVRAELAQLYDDFHASLPLSIDRTEDYWNFLLAKETGDVFYRLRTTPGPPLGYARIGIHAGRWKIRDWSTANSQDQTLHALLRALVREAGRHGNVKIGGWLPDCPPVHSLFQLQNRKSEITMLKSLRPDLESTEPALAAAGYFREIDHV